MRWGMSALFLFVLGSLLYFYINGNAHWNLHFCLVKKAALLPFIFFFFFGMFMSNSCWIFIRYFLGIWDNYIDFNNVFFWCVLLIFLVWYQLSILGLSPVVSTKKAFSYLTSYLLILLWMFSFICLSNQIISKQALTEKDSAGLCGGSKMNKREECLETQSTRNGRHKHSHTTRHPASCILKI